MTYKTISSPHHPLIADALTLHRARGRHKQNRFLAEGKRTCESLIEAGYPLATLFVRDEHRDWAQKLRVPPQKIIVASAALIAKMSTAQTPSGVVAVFEIKPPSAGPLTAGIVLAQIHDPGNMGTLIRSAAAFGRSVIIVEGTDPYGSKVVQASAGSFGLTQLQCLSWQEVVQRAKAQQLPLTALVVQGGTPLEELPPRDRLLVVGSEAHGLPETWLADCAEKATLAMPGKTESLNAAVAGSIALYITRQKL